LCCFVPLPCSAEVVVQVSDVTIAPDGIGRVRITAFDNNTAFPVSLSGFNIGVEIRDLVMPSNRLVFLDDGTAQLSRDSSEYVFAGKSLLGTGAGAIELKPNVVRATDFISFNEPAVSLGTPRLLLELQIGSEAGMPLDVGDQYVISLIDDPNDRNDFLLVDAGGSAIAARSIMNGSIRVVVAAVPEPSAWLVLFLGSIVPIAIRRRRGKTTSDDSGFS